MSGFDLALWIVKSFLLSHLALIAIPLAIAGAVVLAVFFPTEALAFVRSTIGKILIATMIGATAGWELHAYVADGVAIERELSVQKQAVADQKKLVAAADARTTAALRQAEAQRATAVEAAARETQAHAAATALQEQIDDYTADLAADAKAHPAEQRRGCALSDDDARRLRRIGAAPRRQP